MRLLYILLSTAADVLQIRSYTQRLVLRRLQLFFKHLHAGCQIILRSRRVSSLILGLHVRVLFVSHKFSPSNYIRELNSRLCPAIWGRNFRVQGAWVQDRLNNPTNVLT
jgi:hypothetical protein